LRVCGRLRLAFQVSVGHFQPQPPREFWQQVLQPLRLSALVAAAAAAGVGLAWCTLYRVASTM
ncbi:unnamed protein product, partial [Closterium sp. Naga37s-1]